jgi:chitodextrinase
VSRGADRAGERIVHSGRLETRIDVTMNRRRLQIGFAALVAVVLPNPSSAGVIINEFCAYSAVSNDWIELWNADSISINLSGYTLTDNPQKPKKWTFPEVWLPSHGFLRIWAADPDANSSELFSGFNLDKEGEFIGLYSPGGSALDSLSFGRQNLGMSFGRFPDGSPVWSEMNAPTPGEPNQKSASIRLSTPEGVYAAPMDIAIETDGTDPIRYTQNGKPPGPTDDEYIAPIQLSKNAVIRARVFVGDVPISREIGGTFIIGDSPNLPVLSVMTDPKNLWDPVEGIYPNPLSRGDAWEKPVVIELIENGSVRFSAPAGIGIQGNISRDLDKKSFQIYFRKEYGLSNLAYPLFGVEFPDSFKRLVLYCGSMDQPTGDSNYTLTTDVLTHALFLQIGRPASAFKPVSLYLNGQYWGLYWIRESIDKYYVESHFGLTDIDLLRDQSRQEYLEVREGDALFWNDTFQWIASHDLKDESDYNHVIKGLIEPSNYTDYHIMNIFAANWAWPHENVDRFRDKIGDDPRWRWVMWDTDVAWKWEPDLRSLDFATRDTDAERPELLWSTAIIRKLLENENFKIGFVNRFADLMNSTLSALNIQAEINRLAAWIAPEIPREQWRWVKPYFTEKAAGDWELNVGRILQFAQRRPDLQRAQICDKFGLNGTWNLTLRAQEGRGSVTINSIIVRSFPWQGVYFNGIPVTIRAMPDSGYHFDSWVDWPGKTQTTTLVADTDMELSAVFHRDLTLSHVGVSAITDSTAVVSWTSNLETEGRVQCFAGESLVKADSSKTFALNHTVRLDGLAPRTAYRIIIRAADTKGDSASVETIATTTYHEPLALSSLAVSEITNSSAVVSWMSNRETVGWIQYYVGESLVKTDSSKTFAMDHKVRIGGLAPETIYRLNVLLRDSAGGQASAEIAFITSFKPVGFSDLILFSLSPGKAVFTWTTNGQVIGFSRYGWADSLDHSTPAEAVPTLRHIADVTGLPPQKKVKWVAAAVDSLGRISLSDTLTFFTLSDPSGLSEIMDGTPKAFKLGANYPNPFNGETTFSVDVPEPGRLEFELVNLLGQTLRRESLEAEKPGRFEFHWGAEFDGRALGSGLYLLSARFLGRSGQTAVGFTKWIVQQ